MTKEEFESLLNRVTTQLTAEARNKLFTTSKEFENRVRDVLEELGKEYAITIDYDPHPYVFPDIAIGEYGVEVKFTTNATWRSVANSVFETTRNHDVIHIYVIFGKMGGVPEVKWARYADSVIHVRTSHVPRFEVEMDAASSLFEKMGITYNEFSVLPTEKKMHYIRQYARGRLKEGERLWWLEEKPEQEHSLPIQVRLYMSLNQKDKRRFRAEAALLCPQIVAGSRAKKKYDDVAMYLLTYHGVLCPQSRDLFSAGSVALRSDGTRGGNYIQRALADIEEEMRQAALRMDDALFMEYWGRSVAPEQRIVEWLIRADKLADGWVPSQELFQEQNEG